MMPFQVPAPTRYDLNFTLFDIPIRVHPLFWLLTLIIGSLGGSISAIVIWVAVVFVSILVHELGHSLTMRYFGQESYIVLYSFGGLAVPVRSLWGDSAGLTRFQQILIALAGPGAGFLLALAVVVVGVLAGGDISFGLAFGFIPFPFILMPGSGFLVSILQTMVGSLLWVNIFWGLLNLIPVFPLDGGHVATHLFALADPNDGQRKALWLSAITGGLMALLGFFVMGSLYMAFLFGMLAFQSYQMVGGGGRRLL